MPPTDGDLRTSQFLDRFAEPRPEWIDWLPPAQLVKLGIVITYLLLLWVTFNCIGSTIRLSRTETAVKGRERACQLITTMQSTIYQVELEASRYCQTGSPTNLSKCVVLLDSLSAPMQELTNGPFSEESRNARLRRLRQNIDNKLAKTITQTQSDRLRKGTATAKQNLMRWLTTGPAELHAEISAMRLAEVKRITEETKQVRQDMNRAGDAVATILVLILLTMLLYIARRLQQDKEQSEEALKESERRIRSVIDNMLDALIIVDYNGLMDSMNPRAPAMFGYAPDDLRGMHITTLLADIAKADRDQFMKEMRGKGPRELKGLKRNKVVFPIEFAAREFLTRQGKHYFVTMRDVSQRDAVDNLKRQFVSMVSHELRTPLTSMSLSLGLFSAGAFGPLEPKAGNTIALLERNVSRMIALVNDLLDLARMESGTIAMSIGPVPLALMIERALDSVRAFAEELKVAIHTVHPEFDVLADEDRIVQVLVNLLSNAVKFSPPDGLVVITMTESGDWVTMEVTDCGRGVPASAREAIFEPFFQVDKSDAKKRSGTGLGLAICKTIVQKHGGMIGVNSEEGKGSTFWFTLPRSRTPVSAAETRPA